MSTENISKRWDGVMRRLAYGVDDPREKWDRMCAEIEVAAAAEPDPERAYDVVLEVSEGAFTVARLRITAEAMQERWWQRVRAVLPVAKA